MPHRHDFRTARPRILMAVTLLLSALIPASAGAQAVPETIGDGGLLLTDFVLIDGTGAPAREGMALLVRDDRIDRLGPAAELTADLADTPGLTVVDLQGRWLLPGFIDAHAHIESPEAAARALHSGVTTVRVLADSHLRGMGTRDLIDGGHVPGPEIHASGGIVRPVLGEGVIVAFPQFGRYLGEPLRGPDNVAAVVRALLDRGADVIKVGASERAGLMSTDPRRQELTEDEIRAAVEEATAAGTYVSAHAHAADGAHAAVLAGVRSIEHGTYTRPETLELMSERGTFLVPTLAVMSPLADPPGLSADAIDMHNRTWHMQSALHDVVRQAKTLGIPIAASTDGSYGEGDETARIRLQHELEQLVALDFTPLEAIAAATTVAAELLRIDDRTGRIAEGMEADLLVFDRDPEQDLRVLFEPLLVLTNGDVIVDRIY